jgi:hypothetical protein
MLWAKENYPIEELHHLIGKRPKRAGRYWQEVPHSLLVREIINQAREKGWKIKETCCYVNPMEEDMAVGFNLFLPKVQAPEGYHWCLGAMNSNSLKFTLRLYFGLEEQRYHTGMAMIEVQVGKHTNQNNKKDSLKNKIESGMLTLTENFENMAGVKGRLESLYLDEEQKNNLLMGAMRSKIIAPSRIKKVDILSMETNSAWGLFWAFCEVSKESNPPWRQMQNHVAFLNMILSQREER